MRSYKIFSYALLLALPLTANSLAEIHTDKLAQGVKINTNNPGIVFYNLIPHAAKQGWALSLADISTPLAPHYHKKQTQIFIAMEGKLKVTIGRKEVVLSPGESAVCPAGFMHSLTPIDGSARVLAIDLRDQPFPQDVFWANSSLKQAPDEVIIDQEVKGLLRHLDIIPKFDAQYRLNHWDNGDYSAYEIVPPGVVEGNPWSTALLEIQSSPKHYHLKGSEMFIVVNGELAIQVDEKWHHLSPGQFINIPPTKTHFLKSATNKPVRIMCVNFPAFDPQDFYLAETKTEI